MRTKEFTFKKVTEYPAISVDLTPEEARFLAYHLDYSLDRHTSSFGTGESFLFRLSQTLVAFSKSHA